MTAKVIAAVVGRVLRLHDGVGETSEQTAKMAQLAMDTVPIAIEGMMSNLPVELHGQVLVAYEDEKGKIKWGYFPASEVKKGRVTI